LFPRHNFAEPGTLPMSESRPCDLNSGTACGTCPSLCLHDAPGALCALRPSVACATRDGIYRCPYYSWGSGAAAGLIHGFSRKASHSFCSPEWPCSLGAVPLHRLRSADRPAATTRSLSGMTHGRLGRRSSWALLDHLDVRQSYLFGSSFGSTVTLAALHAHPERVAAGHRGRAVSPGGRSQSRESLLGPCSSLLAGINAGLPLRAAINRQYASRRFSAAPTKPEIWDYFVNRHRPSRPIAAVARRAVLMHRPRPAADPRRDPPAGAGGLLATAIPLRRAAAVRGRTASGGYRMRQRRRESVSAAHFPLLHASGKYWLELGTRLSDAAGCRTCKASGRNS